MLPQDFSTVQGTDGFSYESIGDSRSSNTQNPAPAGTTLMGFQGDGFPFDNYGPLPTYSDAGNFPLVQIDAPFGALLMHPGTGGTDLGTGTANIGASIAYQAPTTGYYVVSGDFARDNANVGAGDGVDVLVVNGTDLDTPILSAHIDSSNAVDVTNPFAGTGKVSFNLTVPLAAGDALRFIVFSDAQGQDGTYDTTAFRVGLAPVDPAKPLQNPLNPLDVNCDGEVTPLDVLDIINELNAHGSHALSVLSATLPADEPPTYLDVDGDNFVSPADALQVINYLNSQADAGSVTSAIDSPAFASPVLAIAVPEPSSAALASCALLTLASGLFCSRKLRQRIRVRN